MVVARKPKGREKDKEEPETKITIMKSSNSEPVINAFISYPSFPSSPTGAAPVGIFTTRRRSGTGTRGSSPGSDSDYARMMGSPSGGLLEDVLIIFGLIAVQIINSIYVVALSPILALGIKPLFLIIFACTATSLFVLPFAIAHESKKWPARLSPTLIAQFVLIALTGVTTFQALMLLGIEKTSPAIASAMPNLAPGIIFVISACLRFEKVDLSCEYTRAKILGTIICLGGAMTMSFLQSPTDPPPALQPQIVPVGVDNPQDEVYNEWIIGCLYLLGAVVVVSCSTVLQAVTMVHFPAPFSLCVITSMLGAIFTAFVQVVREGKVDPGNPTVSLLTILSIVLLGGMVISMCVSFQTWAVKKKGPVLVSMFSPIQTVCSAVLSAVFLGRVIQAGSLAGMFIMFAGLYMVLWAKKKEGFILPNFDNNNVDDDAEQSINDVEKPLLS